MTVNIVDVPEQRLIALEHRDSPDLVGESVKQLIAWRIKNHLLPDQHATYSIHYDHPSAVNPDAYRLDLCIAVGAPEHQHAEHDAYENMTGWTYKTLAAGRCACVRHWGSTKNVSAASYLYATWLPQSGEVLRDFPMFFHHVNVGKNVREEDLITDVYLPIA